VIEDLELYKRMITNAHTNTFYLRKCATCVWYLNVIGN